MNWGVLLPVLQIVVPLLVAGIGYEMGHNPPKTLLARNLYRASFVVLLVLVTGISYWQTQRTVQTAKRSERDLSYVKAQLADMGKLLVGVVKEAETRRDQPLVASAIVPRKPLATSVATERVVSPNITAPVIPDKPLVESPPKEKELVSIPPPPPPIPTAEASSPKLNKCDLNGDGKVDVRDVQEAVNRALGNIPRTHAGDVNGDGIYSVVDVQRVVNASLGGRCP